MFSLKSRFILSLILLLAGLPLFADGAGETRAFDAPTLRLQAKADDLYRKGHWERAHFIYVNELAAVGDKYSQYMAGYMCLTGKGVPRDPVMASAWYRIAAERGRPEYVKVRDELLETLNEDQSHESDRQYLRLRQKYSDLVVAIGFLRDEFEDRDEVPTGSRVSGSSSSVTIIDRRTGLTVSRSEYIRRLESRIKLRLDYITNTLGIDPVDPGLSDREFDVLVDQVNEYLRLVDDR